MVYKKPIKVSTSNKKKLDKMKVHPRETYDDIISRLLNEQKPLR